MRKPDRLAGGRPAPVLAVALVLAVAAACATQAPAGTSSAAPASAALPTAAPPVTAPPSADLTPVPGAGGGEPLGTVIARNIAFEPPVLAVPASEAFVLALRNEDSGIPHTLQVSDPNGGAIATTDVITGPGEAEVDVPALEPGSYTLVCTIPPTMTATLTAE